MNDCVLSSIQPQKKTRMMTSKTEASLTSPEIMATKKNDILVQLKQEIQEAQYACKLMEEVQARLEGYVRSQED